MTILPNDRHSSHQPAPQSPELSALLTQMQKERETFDERMVTLRENLFEMRIAADSLMQCARAVAAMADKEAAR